MTLYNIKPRFQSLLRPMVGALAARGITANQVTLTAATGSILLGLLLIAFAEVHILFLAIPAWMLIRMALNAIDGMLAREHNQQSTLGACLNELCDVISDAALYAPFAFIAPFNAGLIALVIFLSTLSEFAGTLGPAIGASRRYDGPSGKSDRALIFGLLGLWVGIAGSLPSWMTLLIPLLAVLLSFTIFNRVRNAIAELKPHQ